MMRRRFLLAMPLVLLAACGDSAPTPTRYGHYETPAVSGLPAKALPGGASSHVSRHPGSNRSLDAFSQPSANLSAAQRGLFTVGNSFFTRAWVSAPASTAARDGLGPLYNAAACQDCHVRDGRGHPPASPDAEFRAAVVRIATAGGRPHPVYGQQLQTRAVPPLQAEARPRLSWTERVHTLPDGTRLSLRSPALRADEWRYGAPGDHRLALRIPPPMIGVGLLEAIPEPALREEAQRQAQRPQGPRGRLNRVLDVETGGWRIGRFGWKAGQPDVRQQSLHALAVDMGLSSGLYARDECTAQQDDCRAAPNGGAPEVGPDIARAIVFYARHLAPPARRDHERPEVVEGEALFQSVGCADCHRPRWTTGLSPGMPALSGQTIWPYSDLLLHDLGPDLDDGVRDGEAQGRHWRTAPLWGLGHTNTVSGAAAGFLHDGRARTPEEAIAWHGGEAAAARDRWAALPKTQRRKLLRFLASL